MTYRLKNKMHVPPGGYVYREPSTGAVFDGHSLYETTRLVVLHREQNGLPRPSFEDTEIDVENQICMRVGHQWCEHMEAGKWGFRVDWDTVQAGTKALMAWAMTAIKGENPYVDQAEADRRAAICAKCWANQRIPGCAGCGLMDKVRKLVTDAKGDRRTLLDDRLAACLVCGCSNSAQVWIRGDLLDGAMSEHQRACYKEVEGCWKA